MAFQVRNSLRFYTFDSFADLSVKHGVFTRSGGLSPHPWNSLNVGGTVGDTSERVRRNRLKTLASLEIAPKTVYDSWQVHSKKVEVVDRPNIDGAELVKADGLITNKPGIALMMRFADCVPVLLVDPVNWAIGLVHAGWRGTLQEIAQATIQGMAAEFGTDPADIRAGIGPSIGPDHYEVGDEVALHANGTFPEPRDGVLVQTNGRTYLDLWRANQISLERAGVREIETAGICTACHLEDWFSHRAEAGRTGRFAAVLQLTNNPNLDAV